MIYKKFPLVIIIYLAAILMMAAVFAFSLGRNIPYAIYSLLAIVLITISFGFWLNRTNKKLAFFFSAVRNEETTLTFPEGTGFASEKELNKSLNDLNEKLKIARINIELQEKFYRSIMENIRTSIISYYENGVVEFVNPELLNMFNMDHISHIGKLNTIDPKLAQLLEIICTGEQKRLNIKSGNNLMNLDVHCQTIVIQGRELKIVTLQDIKNELDKHEMDSWQKLIRILNHEIMNSVAPITSLSSTLSGFYKSDGNEKTPDLITQKIISDTIRGLNIIEDHGKGLIKFVESYRSLTQLPKPEFKRVNVKELLERVLILANCNLDTYINGSFIRPSISASVIPANLTLLADDKLLAQVFINLIKNAAEAFDNEKGDNKIAIYAFINPAGRNTITIEDNGCGMDNDILEKIFIPFFTTKESGTGIGLSLSKQIMRLHNGNITCDSTPGSGSTFSLIF